MRFLLLITCFNIFIIAHSQHPFKHPTEAIEVRYDSKQPVINYILQVDTSARAINVKMHISNIKDTFRIAMFAHPEYDDRYWRFIKDLKIENGSATRIDSALWQIKKSGNETIISYKIQLPKADNFRAAWRPFITSTGALIGGPQCYMYVVGQELAPSHVQIKLPQGWQSSTGLELTSDTTTFFAPTVSILVDAPILIGNFKKWIFSFDGVPHTIIYWRSDHATNFDEENFVDGIKKIVEQAKNLFSRFPYREYYFLIQDDAYGALEHANSVTLGVPSADLAKNVAEYFGEIAHEYFHTWNLVRIHPAVYDGSVSYKKPPLSKELWWSEGLTMYYADVFLRREGLRNEHATRTEHLKDLLTRYYGNPGNNKISPEQVSLAAYGDPGMLGDYSGSTHLQGELIGTLLDIYIRNNTNNFFSIDDVMRKMNERFSGEKGFTNKDVEQVVSQVCSCDVHSFFSDYIYGNKPLPFNDYLKLIGLQTTLTWKDAVDDKGKPLPDLNRYAWEDITTHKVLLGIEDPQSEWGRAGLHTKDNIISINGVLIKTRNDVYTQTRNSKIGDVIPVEVLRAGKTIKANVTITGYKEPVISIEELKDVSEKQKELRAIWMTAKQ